MRESWITLVASKCPRQDNPCLPDDMNWEIRVNRNSNGCGFSQLCKHSLIGIIVKLSDIWTIRKVARIDSVQDYLLGDSDKIFLLNPSFISSAKSQGPQLAALTLDYIQPLWIQYQEK